jgi:hypothetical protein
MARQCPAHPRTLLSLRPRAARHHVCRRSCLGPDEQHHQVVDLGAPSPLTLGFVEAKSDTSLFVFCRGVDTVYLLLLC